MYEYRVKSIEKIYDGDTITIDVDLGFGISKTDKFRLALIDAPEVRGEERPEGLVSRDWLRERLFGAEETGADITIKTYKDKTGKYGRYIAEVYVDGIMVNAELVDEGLAEYKTY